MLDLMHAPLRWPLLGVRPAVCALGTALGIGLLFGAALGPWPVTAQSLRGAPGVLAIELNQATRAEIESVRAVGVELTERLLQARNAEPFTDWQDLRRRVKGVSRKALEGFAQAGFQIKGQAPVLQP